MRENKIKKETNIDEILSLIRGEHSMYSDYYIATKRSLFKLSLHEIEILYIMIKTTFNKI